MDCLRIIHVSAIIVLLAPYCLSQSSGVKTVELEDWQVEMPETFVVNFHKENGILHASFRQDGADPQTMMVLSVVDMGSALSRTDLWYSTFDMDESLRENGFMLNAFTSYTTDHYKGFKSEGKGMFLDEPCKVMVKIVSIDNYFVWFLEYYGEDLSSEYTAIEESLRKASPAALSGKRTISEGGLSFRYYADKVVAVSNDQNGELSFTFTERGKRGDNFLEYKIFSVEVSEQNLYDEAKTIFDKHEEMLAYYFEKLELDAIDEDDLLGEAGYQRCDMGNPKNSNVPQSFFNEGKFIRRQTGLKCIATLNGQLRNPEPGAIGHRHEHQNFNSPHAQLKFMC